MKLSFRYTIQGEPKTETHYATIRIIECTHNEQSKITSILKKLPYVSPATLGNKIRSSTQDQGENWKVVFTVKNFPTAETAIQFIENLHIELAKATGYTTLEQYPLQLS